MTIDAILPQPRPARELWALDPEGVPRMVIGWRSDGTAVLAMTRTFDTASAAAVWQHEEEQGMHDEQPEWSEEA